MSLDISLSVKEPIRRSGTGVFIRENGQRKELTYEEIKQKWPDAEVTPQEYETTEVYEGNITHNLGKMADHAGIYYALWRPEEKGWKQAKDIIPLLESGLKALKDNPTYYKRLDAENGWGTYDQFVPFVETYLRACKNYPEAEIEVDR